MPLALPVALNKRIANFLTSLPNIDDSDGQRAFIHSAGLDFQLQRQISFPGTPAQFFELLVPKLLRYGQLKDGRNALEAVLESTGDYVGQDRRKYCDRLLQELRATLSLEQQPPKRLKSPSTIRVQLVLEGEIQEFNETKRQDLTKVIAAILDIEKESVRILHAKPATSFHVIVELPIDAAMELVALSKVENEEVVQLLHQFSVKSIKILERKDLKQLLLKLLDIFKGVYFMKKFWETYLKRLFIFVVFMLSISGNIASIVYLVINIQEIPLKISQHRDSANEDTPTEREQRLMLPSSDNMNAWGRWGRFVSFFKIVWAKLVYYLRWASVDLSAITPMLLCWFWGSLTLYSWRLLRLKEVNQCSFDNVTKQWTFPLFRTDTDAFPFYRNYEAIFVQFGFIGTIWGFLIVGWNMGLTRGESAKQLNILDTLMRAFGTALVSTFTAVVLVYAIIPIVQSIFRGLIGLSDSFTPDENMKLFNDTVSQSITGVKTFKSEMMSFTATLGEIKTQISETLMKTVRTTVIEIGKQDAAKEESLIKVLNEIKVQNGEKQEAILTHMESMYQKLDALTSLLRNDSKELSEKLEKIYTAISRQTQVVEAGNKMLPDKLEEVRTAIHEQTQQMRQSSEALHKIMSQNQQTLQENQDYIQENQGYIKRLVAYFSKIFKTFEE